MDYDARCKAAATHQGLDPIMDALEEAKIVHGVAQTGGFCMVVTVPQHGGVWGIVKDDVYYAVWYPGDTWHEGPAEDGVEHETASLEGLVELVSKPGA